MSEATFTPGPWFVDDNNNIWRRNPIALYENGGGIAGDKPLACCNQGWYGEGQVGFPVRANAQLIAAAPDIYEALKIILEYPYCDASPLDVPLVMERARAAIRKAEGEGE